MATEIRTLGVAVVWSSVGVRGSVCLVLLARRESCLVIPACRESGESGLARSNSALASRRFLSHGRLVRRIPIATPRRGVLTVRVHAVGLRHDD